MTGERLTKEKLCVADNTVKPYCWRLTLKSSLTAGVGGIPSRILQVSIEKNGFSKSIQTRHFGIINGFIRRWHTTVVMRS